MTVFVDTTALLGRWVGGPWRATVVAAMAGVHQDQVAAGLQEVGHRHRAAPAGGRDDDVGEPEPRARRLCLDGKLFTKVGVGEIELQVREVSRERRRRLCESRHALGVRAQG